MKLNHRWYLGLLTVSLLGFFGGPACQAAGSYQFLKTILVGGEGGWDYLSIDPAARRLYVTHATRIVVINLDTDAIVGAIADTPGVHGFALAAGLGRGFSSNGKENKSSIVALATLQTLAKVDTGENPDAILYEPGQQEVYAFNGRGKSVTIFAATTGQVLATIPLSGKPEFAVADPALGRVFCNIEDKNEVAVIDTKTHEVVANWPIAPGEEASGLDIDLQNHRLFAGCHNKLMVMMDATNGKVLATAPIGTGVDAIVFEARTGCVFSSNGEGTVTIAHVDGPDKLTVRQTLKTERGARTMALDPKTHEIYLASAKFEPAPAGQRPKIIPGTFKILVYGLKG